MDLTWEEAEILANEEAEWRRRVAQRSHLRSKVSLLVSVINPYQ